jgi:RNA polymerase sigma-70 factor (ECF subfamily)
MDPSSANDSWLSQTSLGLLERARRNDEGAWERIVECYGPIVCSWLRQAGLESGSLPDVAQNVFLAAYRGLGSMRRNPESGSFRGWLRRITRRKLIDHARRQEKMLGGSWVTDHLQHLVFPPDSCDSTAGDKRLLFAQVEKFIRQEFSPEHCDAFFAILLHGHCPTEVAARLGLTRNSVYLACSRIRRRVRQEFADLLPDEL